jgi:hypothetical protein
VYRAAQLAATFKPGAAECERDHRSSPLANDHAAPRALWRNRALNSTAGHAAARNGVLLYPAITFRAIAATAALRRDS